MRRAACLPPIAGITKRWQDFVFGFVDAIEYKVARPRVPSQELFRA
jgi:predicted nucleic acid-binding protein